MASSRSEARRVWRSGAISGMRKHASRPETLGFTFQVSAGFEMLKNNPTCKQYRKSSNNNILDFCHIFLKYLKTIATKVAYAAH
jgi:hypothetical protein